MIRPTRLPFFPTLALATLFLVCPPATSADSDSRSGKASPTSAKDRLIVLDDEALDEAGLDEGNHILIVWATWAPGSKGLLGRLHRLHGLFSAHADVASIVFQDEAQTVERHLAKEAALSSSTIPIYLDSAGTYCRLQGVRSLPELLIVNEGEMVFRGPLPADPDTVIARHLGLHPEDLLSSSPAQSPETSASKSPTPAPDLEIAPANSQLRGALEDERNRLD